MYKLFNKDKNKVYKNKIYLKNKINIEIDNNTINRVLRNNT